MSDHWLHIVGIGEDGIDGLTPATRAVLEAAEIIIGGDRHHQLSGNITAERVAWPSPFNALIDQLNSYRGKRVVVLATGDPLWFSVGARIGRSIPANEITYHPQISAFQLAAARMGWSLADVETLTVHGRPVQQMIAFIQPDQRLLILTTGAETPARIAQFLTERGFGKSPMTVLANMGGQAEQRFDGLAESWSHQVPPFNTLAVDCIAAADAALLPRVPGLADELFHHDGTMTKQEVRAVTLAKLMPMRGAHLWDIGLGCGSVAVEWMAPAALDGLEAPDAVFIGGGLTEDVFKAAWSALRPLGRLVANAVTLESEVRLVDLHARFGGQLVKLSVQRAEPIGGLTGWRPQMPVTQWSLVKR